MSDDRIAGTAKNIGGKAQEGYGRLTGDTESEVRGKLKQAEGAAQDLYGQAKDALSDAGEVVRKSAGEAGDAVFDFVHDRPLTTACIALGIGFLLGRMSHHD